MADEILSDEEVFGGTPAAPRPQSAPAEDGLLSDEDVFGPSDDALRTTLRATTRASAGRDPALVAESERLARKYGLPVDTAERQIDTLRTQEELAQVDTFAQQAPKVAEWMASDPNAAALAKDDRDGLSALEQAFAFVRPITDLQQSVVGGVVSGAGSALSGVGEALNMAGRNQQRMLESGAAAGEAFWRLFSDDLGDRYAANVQAQRDMLPDWVENPFGAVGGSLRTAGSAIEGFAQENIAVDEDRQNLATDIASGLGSLVPYLAAAYLTGGAGVLGLGAAQGVDVQADRAEDAGTYGTVSADAGQALGATVTAVTERMGLGWLMRRLPPAAKATLNKRVADILMGGAGEAAQEMTESAIQDVITKTLVDESFDPFQGLAREGLAAFGVGLIFRGGVHVARMEQDAQQAQVEAETLGNIEAAIGNLKLAELSPERLREVLARLKNSSVSDVFMPVDKFTALFQSDQELSAALDATGVDRAELSLALADNGQVRIPIEGYFTGMTPEQRAAAKPHARLTPAAMTPEEAKSFDREQALREFIEATGQEGRQENDPTNWVYDQVRAQLEAAGTDPAVAEQQAELYAAALRTAIVRSGLSLDQLAGTEQDPRLTIRRDTPDAVRRVAEARNADAALDASIEALRSGRLFSDREVNGARLAEAIRRRGGIDPEAFGAGDLRAQDAQRRGLLRRGGMTVEQALELAQNDGFLQPQEGGYDINAVLDLIVDDLGSTPVFSPEGFNVDRAAFNEATNELGRMLDELGIGREQLAEMDNAAVRAALGMNGPMDAQGIEFDQAAPVDSQAFRDWFQASKVAKDDGTALVVYHGTGEEFEAFDKLRLSQSTGHASSGLGFYFTPSKRSAEGYAENASNGVPADAVLLEVYLSIQNPYTMTLEEAQGFEDAAEAAVTRMMLQSQGYDGVWIPEQNAWVAFEPQQVKSIHNRGTWSRKDPRMLYQSVFHGSPHRGIEQTGFSLQKIGTGEGAQAYGWGLYFAGAKEVAEWYRQNVKIGDTFGELQLTQPVIAEFTRLMNEADAAKNDGASYVYSELLSGDFPPNVLRRKILRDSDEDIRDDALAALDNAERIMAQPGQLYAAEIPDDGDLLDWDAPLSEQPEKVQRAAEQVIASFDPDTLIEWNAKAPHVRTGKTLYTLARTNFNLPDGVDPSRAVSEQFFAAGIPGLRYLDSTSRGAGDGSRNYVIWDEGAISDVRTFYQSAKRGEQPAGKPVPTTVDEVSNVESSFSFAGSQRFPNNRDFKLAIQGRVVSAAKAAKVKLDEFTRGTEQYLTRIAVADGITALRTNANAVGWYNEKVTKALRLVSLIHPEIATDPQAKFSFVWALAVTSNGLKVDKNFELAEKVYQVYKSTGKMPTDVGIGTASDAINRSLGLYNTLIEKHGFDVVERFMTTLQPAGEVEKFTGNKVSGENKTTMVYGAAALGPKIGNGFFMNLYGRFEQLTMDRWLMRTWGRWTGTLVEANPAQVKAKRSQLKSLVQMLSPAEKKAFEAIIKRKLTVGDIDAVGIAIWKASQKPANRKAMAEIGLVDDAGQGKLSEILGEGNKGTVRVSVGDELRKGGNALTKYLDGQKEAPSGPPERGNIRKVFSAALAELQVNHPALTMSDFQALLWYPEKRLYDAAKTADDAAEAYEDDEAPDYANAAAKLARAQGVPDAEIAAAVAAVDAELQAGLGAGGARPGERGPGDRSGDSGQEVAQTLYQSEQGGATLDDTKRGSVNIIPGYPGGLDRYLITLGNRADKSTFLHESAHVFLELRKQINAQVAAIPEAERTKDQQRIVEDDARLLEHLGVDSFDAIGRDQHEAFAESFEAYAREGKAPSPRLKRAFQSFRMWLTRIYRTLKGLPNANLTDEVRGYFDRMLATDEEIDAARSQLSLQPLLTGELRGEMSDEEYKRYLLAVAVSRDAAIEQEGAVQFAYAAKEAERMKSAEMRELRREVEAEINADPVWRAIAMLRTGKTPDGVPLPEGEAFKLDTQAVTDLQGKEWVKKNIAGMHRREGGVHPDMAASVLGFTSATEMLQAITSKPSKRDAIEAEALRRWEERNPDPLLDGALEARVTKAVHNDAAAEMMLREINALSGAKKIALDQLRKYVATTVGKMQVRNLNPNRHKVAEMKHGREAIRAAAKGDKIKAAQARRSQLMAHLSYRAELDAKERAEAFRDEGLRLSKKPAQERLARAGWEGYLDKVNQILASFDLRRMSNKDIERKKSLRAWVEAQQEAGEITALSEELIARVEAGRVANWREASVAEIDAAADALANIQHLAKIKNKLTAARDGREWDEARTDLIARMQESLPETIGGEVSRRDVGDVEQARRGVTGALANLNRPENVIEALDGGESGPWHDYVWTVLQDAENKAVGYRKELGAKLKAMRAEAGGVFKSMQDKVVVKLPNERGQVVDVTVSRATLIGIALNTGNATNMQRLVDGGIVSGSQRFRLGPQNVQQILSELRADELQFVQGMWDTVNSLWPDIVNLQRRMSGLPPEKVEARELTVRSKDGNTVTLAGGYWPLVYDSNRSVVGETQDGADAMRMMMGAGFTRAFTPKGYQKARVESFEAPLQLDFGAVMSRHMDHVITDLSHREAVRDINRILSDNEIKEQLILRVGREGYDNLRGSLSYAVSASSAVAGRVAARWARALDTVLANTSVAALAIRPDIALGNLTSAAIQGLDRVGVRALMRGWWALETSRTKTTEAIVAKSGFMAQRLGETDFEFQQELQRLSGRRGWGPAYRRMMMALHRAADAEVTRALWWGRYQQALDAGEGESQAVLMADKAVRQTQTASGRKDVSTFERDTQFKQARQFMGPMFVIFGRLYAAARGEGATQRVGARTATLITQVFLAPAIFALAAGRGPEDGDDDEEIGAGDWARWLAVNVGLFPIMTIPYLRDLTAIGEAAITGGQANPRANPTTQAVVSMGRAFQSLGQNVENYGETGEIDYFDATRDIFLFLGPIVGAPAAQVRITTKTIESVLDDPEQGKVEMAKMAVYGPPRETR